MKIHGFRVLAATTALALAACAGSDGANGPAGAAGANGAAGTDGAVGPTGAAGPSGANAPVADVVLPGNAYFPESIATDDDDNLYVSSAATGAVSRITRDGQSLNPLVAAEPGIGKLGLAVDPANKNLYVCTVNTQTFASTLRRYELASGTHKETFELAKQGGVCNDLAFDGKGNLYVTDSFFGIERLPAGGSKLEVWKEDPLFTAGQGQFAVDGIVVEGTHVYANNLTTGALVHVPIEADGKPGTPAAITIKDASGQTVTLAGPDGMRLGAGGLLVAESFADAVGLVRIDPATNTATRETFANRVDRPSSVTVTKDAAWITEGQIGRLFKLDNTAINYPFYVKRIPLH